MRRIAAAIVTALAVAAAGTTAASAGLNPGGLTPLTETVGVNVVFVGTFGGGDPSWSAVAAGLPTTASPKTRSKLLYGLGAEADLGITYTYAYTPTYTTTAWENAFFGYLSSIAQAKPRTLFQDEYNAQNGKLDVGQNYWIDAPSAEKWVIQNPPAGVDLTEADDHARQLEGSRRLQVPRLHEDERARPRHRLQLRAEPRSRGRSSPGAAPRRTTRRTRMSGPRGRVWLYDLSAGPESWGGSYEVDEPRHRRRRRGRLPHTERLGVHGNAAGGRPSRLRIGVAEQ